VKLARIGSVKTKLSKDMVRVVERIYSRKRSAKGRTLSGFPVRLLFLSALPAKNGSS